MSSEVMHVAVTCGGYSGEAEISRKSAAMVVKHMDRARFLPTLVHINRDGWFAETAGWRRFPIDKGDFSWKDDAGVRQGFDAVFEMVHGTPGEDGRLSAYFELMGLPLYGVTAPHLGHWPPQGLDHRAAGEAGAPRRQGGYFSPRHFGPIGGRTRGVG